MEENYKQEQLKFIDELIERFQSKPAITDIPLKDNWAYDILEGEGIIKLTRDDLSEELIAAIKNDKFEGYLAIGTFSERYKRKLEKEKKNTNLSITNNNIQGNNNIIGTNNTIVAENKNSVVSIKQGNVEIEKKSILGKIISVLPSFLKCE